MADAAVEVAGVTVVLGGRPVLSDVSLEFEAGRIHGVIGRGGSGKTVLLKTVATLIAPRSGSVTLFGARVRFEDRDGLRALRSRIGMQFQNLALFDFLDIAENVAFPVMQRPDPPPRESVEAEVRSLLRAVGLAGTERLRVHELSGGMQRRVAMARAVMGRPDLCIHDDPTAGLDPVNSSRIFALIRAIQRERGTTVLVASQDVDRLIRICDRIHVLEEGRVVFSGDLSDFRRVSDPRIRLFLEADAAP